MLTREADLLWPYSLLCCAETTLKPLLSHVSGRLALEPALERASLQSGWRPHSSVQWQALSPTRRVGCPEVGDGVPHTPPWWQASRVGWLHLRAMLFQPPAQLTDGNHLSGNKTCQEASPVQQSCQLISPPHPTALGSVHGKRHGWIDAGMAWFQLLPTSTYIPQAWPKVGCAWEVTTCPQWEACPQCCEWAPVFSACRDARC